MKHKLCAVLSAVLLCTLCAAPAHALEYTFAGADNYLFGRPTSDDTIYGWENPNVDRSKNTALIPPAFGVSASYLPNQSVTVDSSGYPTVQTMGFTEVTNDLYYSDGSLGVLKIPSIGLTVSIYEGTDSAALAKGAGHFEGASIWDGNVAIAAHNRGVRNDFGKIHTLKTGDIITLTTVLGTRTYAVSSVTEVSVYDTSGLAPSAANMITLYTCVEDQPDYRWRVRGVELAA